MRRRFLNNINKSISGSNHSEYFTIEALEDGLIASLSVNACEYSLDGNIWNSLSADSNTPSINKGQTLSFRGNLTPKSYEGIGTFTISKKCNIKGNIMSLLYGDDFEGQNDLTGKDCAFYNLFYSCKTIVDASELILPATTLAISCYELMFCYCTSLTTAPALPATTLVSDCYYYMFYNCTSLTTAPALPATTLADYCYYCMFYNCSKLNYIKMLATDISVSGCLSYWVSGVASSGTFVKHTNMTSLPSGTSGIPNGWTVVNDGEEVGSNLITFTIDETEYQAEEGMTWELWCDSGYNTRGFYIGSCDGANNVVVFPDGSNYVGEASLNGFTAVKYKDTVESKNYTHFLGEDGDFG